MSAWTSNIWVLWIVAFILGPCIIGRMSSGFLILMESVPTKYQATVGACIMVGEGLCPIIWTVYFQFNRNSIYFMYFAASLNLVTSILSFFFLESPRYLFGTEKFERARDVFN